MVDLVLAEASTRLSVARADESLVRVDTYHPPLLVTITYVLSRRSERLDVSNIDASTDWNFTNVESNIYRPIVQDAGPAGGGGGGDGGGVVEMDLLRVGSEPVGMRCPHCQEDVMTNAVYRTTTTTHVVAAVLAVFFWWLCCCVLPYLLRMCKNVEHYCPHCRQYLGVYTRNHIV